MAGQDERETGASGRRAEATAAAKGLRNRTADLRALGDLALELVRVRSEARAARLEARAALLELKARRLRRQDEEEAADLPSCPAADLPTTSTSTSTATSTLVSSASASGAADAADPAGSPPLSSSPSVAAVEPGPIERRPKDKPGQGGKAAHDVVKPQRRANRVQPGQPEAAAMAPGVAPDKPRAGPREREAVGPRSGPAAGPAAAAERGGPRKTSRPRAEPRAPRKRPPNAVTGPTPAPPVEKQVTRSRTHQEKPRPPDRSGPGSAGRAGRRSEGKPGPLAPPRRKRPAGWLVSTAAHIAIVLLLAGLTLRVPPPRDQLVLAARPSAATAKPLEPFQIEPTSEADPLAEAAPPERTVPVAPLGDLPNAEPVAVATPPPPPVSQPWDDASFEGAFQAEQRLSGEETAVTRFCGVEGGGNRFCYVVDSSLSMKGGRFQSARAELLRSIDQLRKDQRFYVIFYDTNLARMAVSDPPQPDPHALPATAANKQAVRRWALQVELERGGPPGDALEIAFGLRPDVIFLLSDGEFPVEIETQVAELNRNPTLFGERGPRTILHTIGYDSRDGETRLRRLAAANGGQYRYVAAP